METLNPLPYAAHIKKKGKYVQTHWKTLKELVQLL
jgi:hypothetical protein